jgi:diguanylate cyclase (GGDEF)-like protein
MDAQGEPVASSSDALSDPGMPGDWLPALVQGETMLGDPYWDEALGAVAAPIAVPIEASDTRFMGVLHATMTFEAVRDVLSGLVPGEAGRIELLASDGRIIVASGPVDGFEVALDPETLASLASAAGGTTEYLDADGVEMIGTLTGIDRMAWSVLARVPTDEAYARITQLGRSTALLVSFLLLVVGTVAYFIGLFIVRPLDRLTVGASAVAGGDLSVDLPVTGRDEVALLTEVFNGMVAELRAKKAELDEANAVLREQNVELERISMTDALTSLYNRRYVMGEFDKEINRAARHERKLSVLMMDVDKFKNYNDTWGHQAGDQVLMGMGVVIRDATREPDVPARYGGEEFIVLLPDCDIKGAIDAAERVRARLDQEVFEGRKVTISIGAAEFPAHGDTPKALISAADAALYEAKDQGRDRVVAAGQGPTDRPDDSAAVEKGTPPKQSPASQRRTAAQQKADTKKKTAAQKKTASPKKKTAPKKKASPKKKATPTKKKAGSTTKADPKGES